MPLYALYTMGEDGKKLIGHYDSSTDGAMAMDLYRAQHDNDDYTLILEDDDDGTRV